ncbi:hypothetical protein HNQ56_004540 [Anaerotaenia torta]
MLKQWIMIGHYLYGALPFGEYCIVTNTIVYVKTDDFKEYYFVASFSY